MNVNQHSLLKNNLPIYEAITEIPPLEGIALEAMEHLKNHYLSLVYFNTCRNLSNVDFKKWENSDFTEILGNRNQEKIINSVTQFKQRILDQSVPQNPLNYQKVRLKGQEQHHFAGDKCTAFGYTGDDDQDFCMLEKCTDHIPQFTQKYGYQEVSLNQVTPNLLYTLRLGPCIGILMVAIGFDEKVKKAALMHEDYSSPKFSVTDMFKNSFKNEIFNKIKLFLVGGNGGDEDTQKRFNIHKSEINQLNKKYNGVINLVSSTDALDSPNEKFTWNETDVFFSSVESSTYLWILQRKIDEQKCLEVIHVAGPELSYEKLDAYYRAHIQQQQ